MPLTFWSLARMHGKPKRQVWMAWELMGDNRLVYNIAELRARVQRPDPVVMEMDCRPITRIFDGGLELLFEHQLALRMVETRPAAGHQLPTCIAYLLDTTAIAGTQRRISEVKEQAPEEYQQ